MFIVVIGAAQTGMEFVGPFQEEGVAQSYIEAWKQTHAKSTPIGVVPLHPVSNVNAGKQLPEK